MIPSSSEKSECGSERDGDERQEFHEVWNVLERDLGSKALAMLREAQPFGIRCFLPLLLVIVLVLVLVIVIVLETQ